MPLVYENFAHFYRDSGWSEEQQREHLAVISDVLECIVRIFRHGDDGTAKILGITLDELPIAAGNPIESDHDLTKHFNDKTATGAAEGEEK